MVLTVTDAISGAAAPEIARTALARGRRPHARASARVSAACLLFAVLAVLALLPTPAATALPASSSPAPPTQHRGGWVARILRPTNARPHPGSTVRGPRVAATVLGGQDPQELLVLAQRSVGGRAWLKVRVAQRPNDADGWIPADVVRLRHTGWWVHVQTRTRSVRVYRDGRLVTTFRAVVGAPATPTPHGLFAVMMVARQANPHGFLGPWAIHLTAHSNVLENYDGGPGRVAIHGRGGASLSDPLGTARSHGCVRVANQVVAKLAGWLRPGTPVEITD